MLNRNHQPRTEYLTGLHDVPFVAVLQRLHAVGRVFVREVADLLVSAGAMPGVRRSRRPCCKGEITTGRASSKGRMSS
jgi:hypothetical protein